MTINRFVPDDLATVRQLNHRLGSLIVGISARIGLLTLPQLDELGGFGGLVRVRLG